MKKKKVARALPAPEEPSRFAARPGSEERLEALLGAEGRVENAALLREVLARGRAARGQALRDVAAFIDKAWARIGTRSLIIKTILDAASELDRPTTNATSVPSPRPDLEAVIKIYKARETERQWYAKSDVGSRFAESIESGTAYTHAAVGLLVAEIEWLRELLVKLESEDAS